MAVLVLLAASARAGIISPDLRISAPYGNVLPRLGLLTALSLIAFTFVLRLGSSLACGVLLLLPLKGLGVSLPLLLGLLHLLRAADLDVAEDLDYTLLVEVQHVLEHAEGLLLVLELRVPLGIAAEVDALTEVVHAGKVLLPELVKALQHDGLLQGDG